MTSTTYLYEINPTTATFDGVHLHDDLLEDFSRSAIDAQVRTLGGFARRLAAIDPARLTDIERLERPALESSIRARLFELEDVRTWERSPQLFADTLATSLAGQALFDYAPLAERARRVLSKLRQVPRFMQAARDNLKDSKDSTAPGIFIKVGLESLRGTLRFIHDDLPARVCRSRRFAPARRPCRCGGRGLELDRIVRRVSRERCRTPQQGFVPPWPGSLRAQAPRQA